jgi:hypothetical protein
MIRLAYRVANRADVLNGKGTEGFFSMEADGDRRGSVLLKKKKGFSSEGKLFVLLVSR